MKSCKKCNITKPLSDFYFDKRRSNFESECRQCATARKMAHGKRYRETIPKKQEHINRKREYDKQYRVLNKEKIYKEKAEYSRKKRKGDPLFLIKGRLRHRLKESFKYKSWKKDTHFSEYIGCTQAELKSHIESQFTTGMTWDNIGDWHIDHAVPLSYAKTETELIELSHYLNLQPLWAEANLSKGYRLPENYLDVLQQIRDAKRR